MPICRLIMNDNVRAHRCFWGKENISLGMTYFFCEFPAYCSLKRILRASWSFDYFPLQSAECRVKSLDIVDCSESHALFCTPAVRKVFKKIQYALIKAFTLLGHHSYLIFHHSWCSLSHRMDRERDQIRGGELLQKVLPLLGIWFKPYNGQGMVTVTIKKWFSLLEREEKVKKWGSSIPKSNDNGLRKS